MEKKPFYQDEPTTKITGHWGHDPIWRELTPREKIEQHIKNHRYITPSAAKGLHFIADCMDAKVKNTT